MPKQVRHDGGVWYVLGEGKAKGKLDQCLEAQSCTSARHAELVSATIVCSHSTHERGLYLSSPAPPLTNLPYHRKLLLPHSVVRCFAREELAVAAFLYYFAGSHHYDLVGL
jgi:hypothetical protein